MYGLSDRLKPLSAAEEQVLLALWDCTAPATRRDISEKLTATGWAPATVLNFLYRLEEKGWVKGGKAGSQNTYLPTVTRRAYCVAAMRQRMDTLFGGRPPQSGGLPISRSGPRPCQRERRFPEPAGTGHPGAGGAASGGRRIRPVRSLWVTEKRKSSHYGSFFVAFGRKMC
mgnify:CR=1 FL=1